MKRLIKIWVLTVLVVITGAGCEKVLDGLINFDLEPHNVEFDVPALKEGDVFSDSKIVVQDLAEEIEKNSGDIGKLNKVALKKATITIISGSKNFDAFKSFDILISSPSGLEKKIAWVEEIPIGSISVIPNLTSDNLKDFMVSEDEFTLILKGKLREDITEPIRLNAEIKFRVTL